MQTSLNNTDIVKVLEVSKQFSGSIDKVYLFGSFARGEETANSDIDLYYVFNEGVEVFDTLAKIDTAIFLDSSIAREIDTTGSTIKQFLLACKSPSSLKKTVLEEGVLVYGE